MVSPDRATVAIWAIIAVTIIALKALSMLPTLLGCVAP